MRKPLIVANWKMFLDAEAAENLTRTLCESDVDYSKVDVLLAPAFTYIMMVSNLVKTSGEPINIASQNIYFEKEGAYTGEVSAEMVKSCGAGYVVLGHSERRNILGESDAVVNKKLHAALSAGLKVILCVGEMLEHRDNGVAYEYVISQLGNSLAGIKELSNIVIAYEPVWAIGTGKTASATDAQQMHVAVRAFLSRMFGEAEAQKVRILYGGSVKPDNIKELMSQDDIDGALVGGASLKADQFLKIINY